MRAHLSEQTVIFANAQFWQQMLAMTLDPLPAARFFADPGHVQGSVALTGNWTGRIEIRLAAGLAHHATAAMLMQPQGSVAEADTLDAAREIANMIAGSIKSSLPRPCAMAVPEAGIESAQFSSPPSAEDSLMVVFRHPAGDLMVRVCEHECRL